MHGCVPTSWLSSRLPLSSAGRRLVWPSRSTLLGVWSPVSLQSITLFCYQAKTCNERVQAINLTIGSTNFYLSSSRLARRYTAWSSCSKLAVFTTFSASCYLSPMSFISAVRPSPSHLFRLTARTSTKWRILFRVHPSKLHCATGWSTRATSSRRANGCWRRTSETLRTWSCSSMLCILFCLDLPAVVLVVIQACNAWNSLLQLEVL